MEACKISLILIGEKGVGKTNLLRRFSNQAFNPLQSPTVILDLKKLSVEVDEKNVNLEIWDTSGQEKYHSISTQYYKNADGFLLVFDVTEVETHHKLPTWLSKIKSSNDEAIIYLVGNKSENSSKKFVTFSEMEKFAQQESLNYMEVSSKSGSNVKEAFFALIRLIMKKKGLLVEKLADDFDSIKIVPIDLRRCLVIER